MKFVLPSHCSETRFPFKNLVIAQAGATPFIIVNFRLFFRIMVVEKAFHVAIMSATKLSLCTAYNHLSVLCCIYSFVINHTKMSQAVKS